MPVRYGSLPFLEALAFFRAKLNLPTKRWDDLLGAAHDRAFVVAGALQADLLNDLREAVDKAIAQGTTIETFRKDFDAIVKARGWTGWTGQGTKAGEAWRTRVIYDTNLFTSYSAGRYEQMKEVTKTRPYWRYRHSPASLDPRPEHVAWDGIILRHDDPWWLSHSAPNGWGCKCYIETLSERDLKQQGKAVTPHGQIPHNGIDPKTGLPQGIDRGWDYQPGANRDKDLVDLINAKAPHWEPAWAKAMLAQWKAELPPKLWAALATQMRIDVSNAYEVAKAGGRNSGWFKQYDLLPDHLIQKSIRSLQKRIQEHEAWIKNPASKLGDVSQVDSRALDDYIHHKWPNDIRRQQEQAAILQGILEARNR